ncbi:hypothetical protein GOV04_03180 [Candidatus Woesearchaeota archaeon]|nr:hypothetical protein [Candidatus Woesearchaeota archaeon]
MPHQCVRCNKFYEDGAKEILKGCSCGARLFFYIKKEKLKQAEEVIEQLKPEEKKQIEKDVFDIVEIKRDDMSPVVLDFEAINVRKPGKFEIDLVHLFKKDPLVFKFGDGKYVIDLAETFKTAKNASSKRRK